MNRIACFLAIGMLIGPMVEVRAAQSSSMGYSLSIPSNWFALTREEIAENPDIFDSMEAGNMNKELFKVIQRKIKSGKVDMYFRQSDTVAHFVDNINVQKNIQRTPSTSAELKDTCNVLPQQLSSMFGRRISMYECEFRTVANTKAVFLNFDGAEEGTRTLQYQVPKSRSIVLVISATAKKETLEEVRPEFRQMMDSLKIQ